MKYDFDALIDRRNSDSTKWNYYPEEILPMWTADMDFSVSQPILDALHKRIDHGVFGYNMEPRELREILTQKFLEFYGWRVRPEEIVFQTGVVSGFNRVCQILGAPGDGILVQPPVYPPMLAAAGQNEMECQESPLLRLPDGSYEIDFESFESAIKERTRVFILCNPHNPVGRVFRKDELENIAEICLRKNVFICSDEIHCDLIYSGYQHVPIASLAPEIYQRTVTLLAPSKTFNIPGLHCSIAVISDPELRRKFRTAHPPFFTENNLFGLTAALAAYKNGWEWLNQVMAYLETNRDLVVDFIQSEIPQMHTHSPEGTYLAWIDCRDSGIRESPYRFFLDKARIAFSDGASFGHGGEGFIRMNFACPRSVLQGALNRMKLALERN